MSKGWCIENDFAAQKELAAMEDYRIGAILDENKTLRARVARLEGIVRMLIGSIEDAIRCPMHDDFLDELEAAKSALVGEE